jgi:ASC-1-like (ASCH) protein
MAKKLLPNLQGGKVIVVGSIAHKYSKIKTDDIDFSGVKAPRKVYGNAKRFLMFSLETLFKNAGVEYAIAHPGITPTNITSHYPKWISAIIKYPMKWIFTSPQKAGLNIMKAMFSPMEQNTWIGPRIFNIWGKPKLQKLNTCKEEEQNQIFKIAEEIYQQSDKITKHSLGVQEKYYNLIKSGEKIYEGRLNDEKRKLIEIGDIITIQKDPGRQESFDVKVEDKLHFKNFFEMAQSLGSAPIGFKGMKAEEVANIYQEFYSQEKQNQFGVVAIRLKKL